jgi:hypothetical protein
MTLKKQFLMLGFALIVTAGVSAWLNAQTNQLAQTQLLAVQVVQRHMEADMMHDGIRGNVYSRSRRLRQPLCVW